MLSHRLQALLDRLRGSFWLRPAAMVLVTLAATPSLLAVDSLGPLRAVGHLLPFHGGGPEVFLRGLSLLAGTFVSIICVTFSVIIVVFTLANSQFGPRMLENYLADKGNQTIFGFHISAFIFCLVTLFSVEPGTYVPVLTALASLGLGVVGLLLFIVHVQHIAASMKADSLINLLERDLVRNIEADFPSGHNLAAEEREAAMGRLLPVRLEQDGAEVPSPTSGYVAAVDLDGLMRLGCDRNLLVVVRVRSGDFVVRGCPLALVHPRAVAESRLAAAVTGHFTFTSQRGSRHDMEYTIDKLVEVAIRALSPGINDTFTALACIDRLASALSRLAGRRMPPAIRLDDTGTPRLSAKVFSFSGAMDAAFNLIRQNGQSNPAVLIRLLEALALIRCSARTAEAITSLERHAAMILRAAENLPEMLDREDVRRRHRSLVVNTSGCGSKKNGAANLEQSAAPHRPG